jgi:sialate O-acetylesterase
VTRAALVFAMAGLGCSLANAEVRLAGVFGSGMVLQRDVPVPIWGTASPGESVTVALSDVGGKAIQSKSITADANGAWSLRLDPLKVLPGDTSLTLTARASNTLKLDDIVVGDVWLCSGQSNMAYPMSALKDVPAYKDDITSANFPLIRQGGVKRNTALNPISSVEVKWSRATPENVLGFTAAGFYFARALQPQIGGVPIGLLHTSWGGTSAEVWTPLDALSTVPDFKDRAEKQLDDLKRLDDDVKTFPARIAEWENTNGRADTANQGEADGWAKVDADTSAWKPGKLAEKWNKLGMPNGGIGWLRKEFNVPADKAGKKEFRLDLGLVDEHYVTVYFNGDKIAESGKTAPEFYYRYVGATIPPEKIKAGKNVFAIRFRSATGDRTPCGRRAGQFGFKAFGMPEVGDDVLVRVEKDFAPIGKEALATKPQLNKAKGSGTSSCLYNAMVHPLVPYAIKGLVWYQGEQDASRAHAYRTLLPLMICSWRKEWGQGDFPVLIQQLPNWQEVKSEPEEAAWAEMREAQYYVSKTVPNTFISVAIDVGEVDDVHPKNKRDVGNRLALVARAKVYGQNVACSGPVFKSMAVEGATVRLSFEHAGGLKTTDGKPPARFAIAGEDKVWTWADAKIDGESVVLSSPKVSKPVAVRYAWANSPEGANLTNETGLPAMPFRTDDWPGVTDKNK